MFAKRFYLNTLWLRRQLLVLSVFAAISLSTSSNGQDKSRLYIGGAALRVSFDSDPTPAFRKITLNWVARAAEAVTIYYGRFPVRNVEIAVRIGKGDAIGSGRASGDGGPHIDVMLGSGISAEDLAEGPSNWLMTHEMVHLALSGVEEEHHWLEEGLATYVEPIARARAGELSAEKVWSDMVEGIPQGEPASGDRGLDHTPTWGRTYWGGALFCLMADVEIRKQTQRKMGLEDALRGIVAAGGTIETEWGIAKVLALGDKAVGVPVLETLYSRLKGDAVPVDLAALWKELGVEVRNRRTIFHNEAPGADIRIAITRPQHVHLAPH